MSAKKWFTTCFLKVDYVANEILEQVEKSRFFVRCDTCFTLQRFTISLKKASLAWIYSECL